MINAKNVVKFIYKEIIYRHNCLRKIILNRRIYFNNQIIKRLFEWFKVKYNLSILYHSKTNKLIERFNKTLYKSLIKLNKERKN